MQLLLTLLLLVSSIVVHANHPGVAELPESDRIVPFDNSNLVIFLKKPADRMLSADVLEKRPLFLVSGLMDVRPSKVFSDHMILQRGMRVPVWGTASPGQDITVEFAGQNKNAITDENGNWRIQLDTLGASSTGRDLVITGENKVVISDVLVGEIWICSGQSNMQMSLRGIPEIEALVPKAKHIRSFEVKRTVSLREEEEVKGEWSVQPPNSAVAFSFAYFLEKAGDVPVGIIHSSWGSSSIEAWMPRDMTDQVDHFKTIMHAFDADTETHNRITDILAKQDNRTNQEDIFLRRQPNILYNAMMKPLAPFAVRGLVWYQGERNTRYLSGMPEVSDENWFHQVSGMKEYGATLNAWINRYRKEWKKEDMHFMLVMLPGYGKGTVENPKIDPLDPTAHSWAWMRESQMKALELPHTSVINTIDLGDTKNIHPKDKLPIGQRLALEAAKKTLGQDIVAEGPRMESVEIRKRSLVVHYSNANGLKTSNGKQPSGFWIADETMEWEPAKAKIKGQTVVLKAKGIRNPLYIRYAFAGKPEVNLVNGAGLPAYPFRTSFEKTAFHPKQEQREVQFTYQDIKGIGLDSVYNRRDNSDIIKVGNKHYIWYTRMDSPITSGYWGTIWYATSEDEGLSWEEQGMALGLGDEGEFDSHSVFTPNILAHEGKFYLYYTGVKPTSGNAKGEFENNSSTDITAIGLAVADSPDGPFERADNNPVLKISEEAESFDSYRIDDASLLVREGGIWLYYKGRSLSHGKRGPGLTEMGVAYANTPQGPYVKSSGSLLDKSHEVLIWSQDGGVASLASINSSINFAPDGLHFEALQDSLTIIPKAPGLYRPHLEDGHWVNKIPGWGIAMKVRKGEAYLIRFEME